MLRNTQTRNFEPLVKKIEKKLKLMKKVFESYKKMSIVGNGIASISSQFRLHLLRGLVEFIFHNRSSLPGSSDVAQNVRGREAIYHKGS